MVDVIAHRGFSGAFPENTALAFTEAVKLGVDQVELDVRLTADGVPVVLHDPTVDRTTDGTGAVADLTLGQVQSLDAVNGFAVPRQAIPTLAEALDALAGCPRLNVHVQSYGGASETAVDRAIEVLTAHGWAGRSYIAANEAVLARSRQIAPTFAHADLSVDPHDTLVERAARFGCGLIQPGHRGVTAEMVTDAHERGIEVNVFYANELDEMRRLIDLGVDSILTDHPDRLLAVRG